MYRIKNKKFLFTGLFLFLVLLSFPWWKNAYVDQGEFISDTNNLNTKEINLTSEMELEQSFICRGKGLNLISLCFNNLKDDSGKATVKLLDSKGEEVMPPYTIDLGVYGVSSLAFPYQLDKPLKKWGKYTLRIDCTDINEDNNPSIYIYNNWDQNKAVKINHQLQKEKLYLVYNYESYYKINDFMITILLIGFITVLFLVHIEIKEKWQWIVIETDMLVAAVCAYVIIDLAMYQKVYFSIWRLCRNVIPIYLFIRFVYIVTNSVLLNCIITNFICLLFGIINYFVSEFRGTPFLPWDIAATKTAYSIMGRYDYTPKSSIVFAILLFFTVVGALTVFSYQRKKRSKKCIVLNCSAVGILSLILTLSIIPDLNDIPWDVNSDYMNQGALASFIGYSKYLKTNRPKHYSNEYAKEILDSTEAVKKDDAKITAQNIIVIMNESFSDLRVINPTLVSDDYLSYIDSLSENTVKGNLYVPVVGGGTSDTEFEVLTGNSTSCTKTYPYQTVIKHKTDSIATVFEKEGYQTVAFHPYLRSNWNRDKVYPLLGFQSFIDIDQMKEENIEDLRWCVSDRGDYKQVIDEYENKQSDKFFLFNVTMQNHGGYDKEYDNFKESVDLSGLGSYDQAEQYFSLLKESDSQLETLINYFSNVDEPTLICFFGDHQPGINLDFYERLFGKSYHSLSKKEREKNYITPFIIWTNYNIDETYVDKISSNYLETLILKYANITMPKYQSFLYHLYEEYPVISNTGIYDANDQYYDDMKQIDSDDIEKYKVLQYYQLYRKIQE